MNTESTRFRGENSAEKSKTLAVGKTPETLTTPVKSSQFKDLACSMPDSGRSTNKGKDTNSNGYVVISQNGQIVERPNC